jgi:hypothetical protein
MDTSEHNFGSRNKSWAKPKKIDQTCLGVKTLKTLYFEHNELLTPIIYEKRPTHAENT